MLRQTDFPTSVFKIECVAVHVTERHVDALITFIINFSIVQYFNAGVSRTGSNSHTILFCNKIILKKMFHLLECILYFERISIYDGLIDVKF